MTSFGILTLNNQQEEEYYQDIGKCAEQKGMSVHRFAPSNIDPYTEEVSGETYSGGNWKSGTFAIPDILYDRCFYSSRESFKINAPIVEWLKNRTVFLGFGLPNKWKVYEIFKNNPYLSNYTIDTEKAVSANMILNELSKGKTVLLKPETGSQGKGIFIVEKRGNRFLIKMNRQGKQLTKDFQSASVLKKWLNLRLSHAPFLIQPYLSLRTQEDRPFDIRIVMQKNAQGDWAELGRGVRIGKKGGIAANLHNNGKLMNFDEWLRKLPRVKRSYLQSELTAISERIPGQLESAFGPLFELGLDIGIDREGAVWILEANSKPGHRTIIEGSKVSRDRLAESPLLYGSYLLRQKELKENDG